MRVWLDEEPTRAHIERPGAWRALIADAQTAGRGRRGRRWVGPPGGALLTTLATTLPVPLEAWPRASLVVGAALIDALEDLGVVPAGSLRLKWPNDVLALGPRGVGKLAGVLCERVEARTGPPAPWLCGIGLNLRAPPDGWPDDAPGALGLDEIAPAAATSALDDGQIALAVLERVRTDVTAWARGDGRLLAPATLQAKLASVGHPIAWRMGPQRPVERGRLRGLDATGALLVEPSERPGTTRPIVPWQIESVGGPDAWHHPRPRGARAPGRRDAADH